MTDSSPSSSIPAPGLGGLDHGHGRQAAIGVGFGIAAYGFWGITPLYFKALTSDYYGNLGVQVSAMEIFAHRIVWAVLCLAIILTIRKQWNELVAAVTKPRTLITLLASTVLIGINWYTYIWAIENERVQDVSLGYYLNPLVNVLLGFLFLQERMRKAQTMAVILAAVCFVFLMIFFIRDGQDGGAEFPWPALLVAFSFGLYGLLRKIAPVNGVPGLTFEAAMLTPFLLWYIFRLSSQGESHFAEGNSAVTVLLLIAGPVTIFPLLCFANAAKRLRLSTLGFIQYLAPTEQLLISWLLFGEVMTRSKLIAFAMIWVALGIYSWDTVRATREARQSASS